MRGRAAQQPRTRWFGSVRVRRDGHLVFSPLTFKGLDHVSIWDKSPDSVSVLVGGRDVMLLYLWRRRIVSACFNYMMTADQLCEAVSTLQGVSGGLEGWLIPALEWTQADLAGAKKPRPHWPDLVALIPHLLEFCRALPVSEVWRSRRQQVQKVWARRLRSHPEAISQVTAQWMLPEWYRVQARTDRSMGVRQSSKPSH